MWRDLNNNAILVLFCRHCCIGSLVTIILCIQILWLRKLQGWFFHSLLHCITVILFKFCFQFETGLCTHHNDLFLSFRLCLNFEENKLTMKYQLSLLARKYSWTSIFNHINQTCEVGLNHSRDHITQSTSTLYLHQVYINRNQVHYSLVQIQLSS